MHKLNKMSICAGTHKIAQCPRKSVECTNCKSKTHTANSTQCPKYQTYLNKINTTNDRLQNTFRTKCDQANIITPTQVKTNELNTLIQQITPILTYKSNEEIKNILSTYLCQDNMTVSPKIHPYRITQNDNNNNTGQQIDKKKTSVKNISPTLNKKDKITQASDNITYSKEQKQSNTPEQPKHKQKTQAENIIKKTNIHASQQSKQIKLKQSCISNTTQENSMDTTIQAPHYTKQTNNNTNKPQQKDQSTQTHQKNNKKSPQSTIDRGNKDAHYIYGGRNTDLQRGASYIITPTASIYSRKQNIKVSLKINKYKHNNICDIVHPPPFPYHIFFPEGDSKLHSNIRHRYDNNYINTTQLHSSV